MRSEMASFALETSATGMQTDIFISWTNMGVPNLDDGSIERADLDGRNRRVIVPQGVTHTPKQIHLDKDSSKIYWCDREGMRVMRANLDGSNVETLVETGRGDKDRRDQTRWCVKLQSLGSLIRSGVNSWLLASCESQVCL